MRGRQARPPAHQGRGRPAAASPPPPAVKSRRWWWVAIAAYAVVILIGSLIPIDVPAPVGRLDKVAHLCEYLLFAWLLVQGVRATRTPERHYLLWAWIYATSYGLLIELLQVLVPWRSAELADALANALGAALGVWLGQHFPRKGSGVIE